MVCGRIYINKMVHILVPSQVLNSYPSLPAQWEPCIGLLETHGFVCPLSRCSIGHCNFLCPGIVVCPAEISQGLGIPSKDHNFIKLTPMLSNPQQMQNMKSHFMVRATRMNFELLLCTIRWKSGNLYIIS